VSQNETDGVSAVMRVFAILQALGGQETIGVSELSQRVKLSKSTVFRFLQTLKTLGYIRQEGDSDKYGLGMKLFQLGAQALPNADVIRLADARMRLLSQETREALHLGMLDGNRIVYVHKIDALYALRMQSRIGSNNPLHSTAIGKVLLAWGDVQQVPALIDSIDFIPSTARTLGSAAALRAELALVRQQGFGEDNEEQEVGLRCLASPIFDHLGQVIAGLSLSFPASRCSPEVRAHYIDLLVQAAATVSAQLGAPQGSVVDKVGVIG